MCVCECIHYSSEETPVCPALTNALNVWHSRGRTPAVELRGLTRAAASAILSARTVKSAHKAGLVKGDRLHFGFGG